MEEKNGKIKINLNEDANYKYYLMKLKDSETIQSNGNTKRFCDILANNWVLVNQSTKRVENDKNPHISQQLAEQNCNNWKIDGLSYCYQTKKEFTIDKTAEYIFDTINGTITRKLNSGESYCKNCGGIRSKADIVGAYCTNCLTQSRGLAHRFGYHCFNEEYVIREKIDTTKTAVFGCEIERDFTGGYNVDFEDELNGALLGVVKALYSKEIASKKEIKRSDVFMRDGSLCNDGCEWITYPQSYKQYKAKAEAMQHALEVFNKYNFNNSSRAGNHIHINRDFFGSKQNSKVNACKLALLLSRFWSEFKAIALRDNTDYTTQPPHKANDDIYTLIEKSINNSSTHTIAINTQHNNTIEFRIWSGINSTNDLLLYLDITQSLAIYAKKKSLETCQKCNFIDLFKHLTDKAEHLPIIIERLEAKGIETHSNGLKNLIEANGGTICA